VRNSLTGHQTLTDRTYLQGIRDLALDRSNTQIGKLKLFEKGP